MEQLNILLIGQLPPPVGGIATWTRKYLDYVKNIKDVSVNFVDLALIGKRAKLLNKGKNIFGEVKRSIQIWREIKKSLKNHIDIVHFNSACSHIGIIRDYISLKIVRKHSKKLPIIFHCRCNIEDQLGKSKLSNKYFKKIIDNVDEVFVQNRFSLKFVRQISKTNCVVMPNFIDDSELVDKKIINKDVSKIIFMGHMLKTKGINEIIEASKEFKEITFELAGPMTSDFNQFNFDELSNVAYIGLLSKDQVKSKFSQSDIFLFPSYTEGFSNAILEAMASGMPIITTDVGANLEMIENKGGIIVERNVNSIVDAINKCKNQKLRESMSKWNLEKVKNFYTLSSVIDNMFSRYKELIK